MNPADHGVQQKADGASIGHQGSGEVWQAERIEEDMRSGNMDESSYILRAVPTQEWERIAAVGCHAKSGIAASM